VRRIGDNGSSYFSQIGEEVSVPPLAWPYDTLSIEHENVSISSVTDRGELTPKPGRTEVIFPKIRRKNTMATRGVSG